MWFNYCNWTLYFKGVAQERFIAEVDVFFYLNPIHINIMGSFIFLYYNIKVEVLKYAKITNYHV